MWPVGWLGNLQLFFYHKEREPLDKRMGLSLDWFSLVEKHLKELTKAVILTTIESINKHFKVQIYK